MDDHSPFEPDQLDELLSAELDGELDAAAHDLGMSLDEVSARLRATPRAADRRIALAAAREHLARPPEIDELTAARLRAAAVESVENLETGTPTRNADRSRRWQIFLGAGVAAASIAAIVALASGLGDRSSEKSSTAAQPVAGAAGSTTTGEKRVTAAPTAALGAFSDSGALARAAVAHDVANRASSGAATTAQQPASLFAPSAADLPTTTSPSTSGQTEKNAIDPLNQSARAKDSDSTRASTCATPPQVPVGSAAVLRATATLSGKPVIVLVFAGRNEHVVVIEDTHCVVLNLQMLR